MTKDLKKEQLVLLRLEKQIAGVAAILATGAASAHAADAKLATTEASAAFGEIQTALVKLAEATGQAHQVLNAKAMDAGLNILQASGGVPKRSVTATVSSILGIG